MQVRSASCCSRIVRNKYKPERTALLALALGIAKTGMPLVLNDVPADSPLIEAIRLAYEGRGMVVVRPGSDHSAVSISAYPTSVRGVAALATDVFHNGFKQVEPEFRRDLAA